ncbi:MAG: chemotaxis protein CheW, partial [Lachnospiraceae bacterium]|nr:chemotaxis protein CheW [Lachnospiraceae bacterium]
MDDIQKLEGAVKKIDSAQYIIATIGNEQFGIDISYIDNIVRMQRITRVPKTQKYFKGVINLRGVVIPVMSLRLKFGLEEIEETNATRIIIIKPDNVTPLGVIV